MHTIVKVNLKRLDYDTYASLKTVFEEGSNFLMLARQYSEAIFTEFKILKNKFPKKYAFVKRVIEISEYNDWKSSFKLSLKRRQLEDVIKRAYDDWIYYFKALKAYYKDPSKFTGKPQPPFRYKVSYPVIQFTAKDSKIDTSKREVTINYKKGKQLTLKIPDIIDADELKSVSIYFNGRNFRALFPRKRVETKLKFNRDHWVAIDPGIKNTMTVVTHDHRSFIMRTSKLKQLIAGKMSLVSKKKSRNGNLESNSIKKIRDKFNNKISIELYNIANQFIEFLVNNKIGTVILGQSENFKQRCKLGRKTNRKWVNLPLVKIYEYIEYKCKLLGIKVARVSEEYTSKSDALADDKIPETRNEGPQTFEGKRILRGLYASSRGVLINADVNGALNIAKRYFKYVLKKLNKVPRYLNIPVKKLTRLLNPVIIN